MSQQCAGSSNFSMIIRGASLSQLTFVVPQNLPSYFSTRNHSLGLFLIFQIGVRISQTDFFLSIYTKLGFSWILEQFKQIARVWLSWLRFDQAGASVKIKTESGFCAHISQKELILQCFSSYYEIWTEAFDLSLQCFVQSVKAKDMWTFVV